MKKEYISPKAIAVKIQTTGMLAVSGFNNTLVVDDPNPITSDTDILGREFEFDFEGANKPKEEEDDFDY